jgi:hypothetical protein
MLDFHQNIPGFAFTDYCSQSSQIRRRCWIFLFWCFLFRFRDNHVPWRSSSMMWCSSYIRSGFLHVMWSIHLPKSMTSVPLQQPCVCVYLIFPISILKSLYTIESLTNVLITVTFMAESFLWKSECEFLALPCGIVSRWNCFNCHSQKSYCDASCTKPWLSVTLGESIWGCFWYHTFLLNLLKIDSMNHVEWSSAIKVVHCIITCASHYTIVHHNCTIT